MVKSKLKPASLALTTRSVAGLKTYKRRLRRHDETAIERILTAIQTYGFKVPLLVSTDGEVIDGHLRLAAAQRLGWTEVPVIICTGWSRDQIRGFRLFVNKSSNWAHWDVQAVRLELLELDSNLFDLDLTGFDDFEIADVFFDSEEHLTPTPQIHSAAELCPFCRQTLPIKRKR